MTRTAHAILTGTAIAGTLDLLSAFLFSGIAGRTPLQVLRSVAQGPFGPGMRDGGVGASLAGLCVHYAIMSVMVGTFMFAARRSAWLRAEPVAAGLGYGVLLYLVMYWAVLPLRWPALFPQLGWWAVGNALFSHCICVGLPIAPVAQRSLGRYSLR